MDSEEDLNMEGNFEGLEITGQSMPIHGIMEEGGYTPNNNEEEN